MYKVGIGQDSHCFVGEKDNKILMLGGVKIEDEKGLKGNSDADVILHSLCNALSSAIGGDSLSTWADDICFKQNIKDSSSYVEHIYNKLHNLGYLVVNTSISIEAEKPRLKMEIVNKIKEKIASLLEIKIDQVGVTFTSGEGLTPFGQGKGMQAITIVNIFKND
jgi:2-C-methyl-D-erythritol 2,4-cyclodiphosphate synthase